jgi:pyruvate ferredoxin oxidoreductase alpha subunit
MSEIGDKALSKLTAELEIRGDGRKKKGKGLVKAMTGNQAVAYAVNQIEYGTVAAFPITPSTELAHDIASAVADGRIKTDFIAVESEHSAISTIQAAAAAGTRVFTATSSAGLALMHEILHYYAGSRLPGVIGVVNRSVGGPLNILCDHSTIMAQRDTGWLQFFTTNVQEAYHFHLLAPRLSEACYLPVIVNIDGFELSHITERLEVLPDDVVKEWVGTWDPKYPMATDDDLVVTYPGIAGSDYYSEIKESQMEGTRQTARLFEEASTELAPIIGTKLEMIEEHYLDDAEVAIVAIGSATGTIKDKISDMRDRGVKAGLLIIKCFRPFPVEKVREALAGKEAVGVMERVPVLGSNVGPLTMEVMQSLYDVPDGKRPRVINLIFGLGGRIPEANTVGKALNILDVLRRHTPDSPYRKVYHLDVRDSRKDALLSEDQIDEIYYQPMKKKSVDIRMFARGGEGIKTASKIFAAAAIETGNKYAQGFSVYGAERSGAPTQGYVRLGDGILNERSQISFSDIDIFVNPGLLNSDALKGLREDGIIMVNTHLSPEEIRKRHKIKGRRIYTVDGYKIAGEEIGDGRRNSIAMLAALMAITDGELLDIDILMEDIDKLKFAKKVIEANKRAAARAYYEWRGESKKKPALKKKKIKAKS